MKAYDLIHKYGWDIMPVLSNLGVKLLSNANVFFVDSGATNATDANDGEHGNSWDMPFATVDYAIGKCTANQGDIILVAPGHTETKSASGALVTCDVAGVTIIGVGSGSLRPTLTLSHTGAKAFDIDAANCTVTNFYIDATGIDEVAMPIDVGAAFFTLCDCYVLMANSTKQATLAVSTSGAANAADDMVIKNCTFLAPNAGADEAIELEEVENNVQISNCRIIGDFANACIHNPTGKVLTNLLIEHCYLENTQTGDHSIELISACTGILAYNCYVNDMTQATGVDPGSCKSFECYHCDTVDVSGILCPAAT